MRRVMFGTLLGAILISSIALCENNAEAYKKEAIEWVRNNESMLNKISLEIWSHPEIAFKEHKSSKLLSNILRENGFKIETPVGDEPTAFVATYGSGKPVIGILAEYDALPGLSQKAYVTQKEPLVAGAPGHGCGHNLFGTAGIGAALAAKSVMEKHKLAGTIKVFGCPAEEVLAGKVYMAKAGVFDGLDVCFDWHPRDRTLVYMGSSLALNNFEVTFHGKTAHASGDPWDGRSALDAVELMDIGTNFLREHIKPTARIHYVIKDGGRVPNVVPEHATVWYFVRDVDRKSVDELYSRVLNVAKGAAIMTDTTYDVKLITGVYNLLINNSLSEILKKNLELVGPPQFTEKEQEFAKELQKSMGKEQDGLSTKIETYAEAMEDEPVGGGSTDVGDVSWIVPVASLGTACWPKHIPGHSWGVVTCTGSSIGQKGMVVTSKVIAASVIDVLMEPTIVEQAQTEFKEKTKGFVYKSAIPKEQKPPIPQ